MIELPIKMYEKGKPEVLVNQSKGLAIAEKLDLELNFECLYYMLFMESKHIYFCAPVAW